MTKGEETVTAQSELGPRVRRARDQRRLTLKAVEAAAGISATHISEIERGRTSPTIGVLLRIAAALGRSPAYFLEPDEMNDVSIVSAEDRICQSLPERWGSIERLTAGIPGGRLQVAMVALAPGARQRESAHEHPGDECALVITGCVRFVVAGTIHELGPGDAIHFDAGFPHTYANASAEHPASMVWSATRRDVA